MGCINWAKKFQGLKTNEKLLLIVMADRAPAESGVVDCPTSWLAMDCGWTVQQTNRQIKRLSQLGLLSIHQRFPGKADNSRLFPLDISIEPEDWRRPTKPVGRSIMSTSDFANLARQAMKSQAEICNFDIYFTAMRLLVVQGPTLICRVPSREFADMIIRRYKPLILRLAQEHIKPTIKTLRLWYPKQKKLAIR